MQLAARNGAPARRPARPRAGRRTQPLLLVAGAPLLLVLLLACGPSDEGDGGPEPATVAAAAGGVTTATPTPSESPAPSAQEEEVVAWGRDVCTVIGAFAVDFRASGDPRDPRELELEPRKERAAAMFPTQYDAVRSAVAALGGLAPPPRTAELHRLLLETYRDLDAALREQEGMIAEATTTDEIEASNLLVDQLINLADRQAALLVNAGYCE